MEEILDGAGNEIQKMHRQLSAERHTYDAILARYTTMMGAAEHLARQINGNPPNKAELEACLVTLIGQIEAIAPRTRPG
jgi:hypothetical protein